MPASPATDMSAILLALGDVELGAALAAALAPREVVHVLDAFGAVNELASRSFSLVVIGHPLGGMDATFVTEWFRQAGARCPFALVAPSLTSSAEESLRAAMSPEDMLCVAGDAAGILPWIAAAASATPAVGAEPDDLSHLIDLPEEEGTGASDEEPPVVEALAPWPVDIAGTILRLGNSSLTLAPQHAGARGQDPAVPERLARLLDGRHAVREVIRASGLSPAECVTALDALERRGALRLGPPPARRDSSGSEEIEVGQAWSPPEPVSRPTREGLLSSEPLPELLLELRRRGVTGVLIVQTPAWTLRLDLVGGAPVRAVGGPPETRLGTVLERMGILDKEGLAGLLADHERALAVDPTESLGNFAVRTGRIDVQQREIALAAQTDAKLIEAVVVDRGWYRYHDGGVAPGSEMLAPRPVEAIIERALACHDECRRALLQAFRARAGERRLALSAQLTEVFPRFRYEAPEIELLRQAHGSSLGEALARSTMPFDASLSCIYLLWAAGAIDLEDEERPAAAPHAEASRAAQPVRDVADSNREVAELLNVSRSALDARDHPAALAALRRARELRPNDARILAALAWTLYRSSPGSDEVVRESLTLLREALRADDRFTPIYVSLGRILRTRGDVVAARGMFERALAIDPSDSVALSQLRAMGAGGASERDNSGKFNSALFRRPKRSPGA